MRKGRFQEEEAPGAPEWMVTFSDCMTLLLTFFVLLLSFSSFDKAIFKQLKAIFADALPAAAPKAKNEKDAFLPTKRIQELAELDKGSEKPTLVRGTQERTKEETDSVDFHRLKVFLIASKRIFWGKGMVISSEGREIMSILASFLKEMPNRIVISENGPEDDQGVGQFGLPRAWAVLQYLTIEQKLDKKRFSISAESTLTPNQSGASLSSIGGGGPEHMLEIVLLERSIYN
jgi:chemotaxis protein MotB